MLINVLLDVLALGIVIPVLPPLIQGFRHGDAAQAAAALGLFGAIFAGMTFFAAPLLGVLSDRVGRRPVLLVCLAALGLDYLVMGAAPNLTWLVVGRVVSGFTGASGAVSTAYIVDTTPPEKRAQALGLGGAVWGVGFILGPALGGWIGQFGVRLPFYAACGLTLLGALYGLVVLPESLPRDRRSAFSWAKANPLGSLALLGANPDLVRLSALSFLKWIAHSAVATLFVLYAANRYHLGPAFSGTALAVYGIFDIVVQALLVKPAIDRLGERGALVAGLGFGVVCFGFFALAPNAWVFLLGLPFLALIDLFGPGFQTLATMRVSPAEQGRLQGANFGVQSAAQFMGPGLFSLTYALLETGRAPVLPGASFLIAGGVQLIAVVLAAAIVPRGSGRSPLSGEAQRRSQAALWRCARTVLTNSALPSV